jgi:3-deoxy-D-manno-octulosonic-acid transferase
VSRILTVTESDAKAFRDLGVEAERVSVIGDTRFDQVISRRSQSGATDSPLPKALLDRIHERDTLVFVVGSSWDADERTIDRTLELILERTDNVLTLIVPHEPTDKHVGSLLLRYAHHAIRFSKLEEYNREPIVIVDSIGKLFGLYSIADIAMVGGGFGAGIHNVLEAAVWRVPVIFGPKHERSVEAEQLMERTAAFSVANDREFDFVFWKLAKDAELRDAAGAAAEKFVHEHAGATERVLRVSEALLAKRS